MSTPSDIRFLVSLKVEPKAAIDQVHLIDALVTIDRQDRHFRVEVDPESCEIILRGQSEQHLDFVVHRLINEFKIGVVCGAPQVAYRETVTTSGQAQFTCDKSTSGQRQFARVALRVEPLTRDSGNKFESDFIDHPLIDKFSAAVRKGVESVLSNGVLAGFPITDVKVTWIDGSFHENFSTPVTFEIAARGALREACNAGKIAILEPIMQVEAAAPARYTGALLSDFNKRRAQVFDQRLRDGVSAVRAYVPLANMFGYQSALRSVSDGQATHSMRFSHYAEVPRNIPGNDPGNFPPAIGMRA